MKTVGERIYDLREDESTTIRDLAKELQISESQLSRIESGKTATISSDILTGLARHFHVSTDYILGLSPVRQNTFILSDLHLTETACMKLARKEINGDTLSRLMEHKDFGHLIKSADAYLNDTYLEGVKSRNDIIKMGAMFARDHADDYEHSILVPGNQTTTLQRIVNMVEYKKRKTKGEDAMARGKYTAAFKAKIVLEVLQGARELEVIAAENNLNPNMVRNWKSEFLENASSVFEEHGKQEREAKRQEAAATKERDKMLKLIGQLTVERDFLQDCFRAVGQPVPKFDSEKLS